MLSELHPEAVVMLNHQYRMNESIMLLTNTLVYNHRMRCGNEQVAKSKLNLPRYQEVVANYSLKRKYSTINFTFDT